MPSFSWMSTASDQNNTDAEAAHITARSSTRRNRCRSGTHSSFVWLVRFRSTHISNHAFGFQSAAITPVMFAGFSRRLLGRPKIVWLALVSVLAGSEWGNYACASPSYAQHVCTRINAMSLCIKLVLPGGQIRTCVCRLWALLKSHKSDMK